MHFKFLIIINSITTDRPTNQPTNGRTDKASYRDAWTHLKTTHHAITRDVEATVEAWTGIVVFTLFTIRANPLFSVTAQSSASPTRSLNDPLSGPLQIVPMLLISRCLLATITL